MNGAIRALPSQPLATLAPKTASGGKIRASRFMPGSIARNRLYRFGKTRPCGEPRGGHPILANTIGNLVADGISGHQAAKVQRKVDGALAAPETDAESKAINATIAADPVNSLQWGGTTVSAADAHQMMLDRMRMDQLASTGISKIPEFQKMYADFQAGLTAADAYNTVSNQTILGDNIHRVTSGAYVQGLITDDAASGFQGYLYHADNGNRYIFADAGTNDLPGQHLDQLTDWALGGDQKVAQLTIARNNATQLAFVNHVPNLSFAGHSLGGALAIVQGLTVGAPVVTFNSAPFSATMARVYGVSLSQANNLITDYRVANDPLSMAEDNHKLLAAGATAIVGPALILVPSVRDVINRAWNLTPPPGDHVPLPAGASGLAAHSMVNVLNLMTDRYSWYGKLPGNGH